MRFLYVVFFCEYDPIYLLPSHPERHNSPPKKMQNTFHGCEIWWRYICFFWVHFGDDIPLLSQRLFGLRSFWGRYIPTNIPPRHPQLMVNCCFGSGWFGIRIGVRAPRIPIPIIPFIFGDSRNPNHQTPQTKNWPLAKTLPPSQKKTTATCNPRRSNVMKFWNGLLPHVQVLRYHGHLQVPRDENQTKNNP